MRSVYLTFLLLGAASVAAQSLPMHERDCAAYLPADVPLSSPRPDPRQLYEVASRHKMAGTASYYSTFFNGRKTANGEIFHNTRFSAAHRTLPMGSWVQVACLATGKKIRLRVNDRGPFKGGFVIDLSQAAARQIGVDRARDRRVEITLLALPGEDPPPEESSDDETESTSLARN
jgi:rare lipoprotein A